MEEIHIIIIIIMYFRRPMTCTHFLPGEPCLFVIVSLGEEYREDRVRPTARFIHVSRSDGPVTSQTQLPSAHIIQS